MQKSKNSGGKRGGAGRPKKDNQAFIVRCLPEHIQEVREFAKNLNQSAMNDHQLMQAIENSDVFKTYEKFKQGLTLRHQNIQRLKPYYEQAKKYGIEYLKQNPNIMQSDVKLIESIL